MRGLIVAAVVLLAACSSSSPEGADASTTEDAGTTRDAGATDGGSNDASTPSGSLCQAGPCPETCFRPYVCVTECGGAETECGCCACAAGAIDTIDCPGG